jgi:hypothetical protein
MSLNVCSTFSNHHELVNAFSFERMCVIYIKKTLSLSVQIVLSFQYLDKSVDILFAERRIKKKEGTIFFSQKMHVSLVGNALNLALSTSAVLLFELTNRELVTVDTFWVFADYVVNQ